MLRYLMTLTLLAGASTAAWSQAIPRDEYLRYVPLGVPPLVEQTEASAAFQLFGDRSSPSYRDLAPLDGIDDARGRRLQELGARFGPIMVLNSTNLPMNFRKFFQRSRSSRLYVDTWSLVGHPQELMRSDEVYLRGIAAKPCSELSRGDRDSTGDCLLLDLLRRYSPENPDFQTLAPRSVPPNRRSFEVMYFDFPGEGPASWKREFQNSFSGLLPGEYRDYLKVYMHPFIHELRSDTGGTSGYEFVLQYYFFYPTNDGGNNHEGDWEHINVSITPKSSSQRWLTADQVRAILGSDRDFSKDAGDPLVIRYVDYYFHDQVFRMDYQTPDAYAPREIWEAQYKAVLSERHGEKHIWKAIRANAWWDAKETVPNTHPICYVGADNKGLDQLLSTPGGKNRDSHGTYPFPGLYKDIGPGGATEQINSSLDHCDWYRRHQGDISGREQRRFGRGDAVPYTTTERIEVLPDWERVSKLVMENPAARRDWFWMILPVRWGYPASKSPFAGVVSHAETGNLSPFGPMSQPHWNRSGSEGGSNEYEPNRFATLFPLGFQDSFVNSWGYMNLTLPVVATLPPVDFAWRMLAYPFRQVLGSNEPVYFPSDKIPSRFVGLGVNFNTLSFNEDTAALLINGQPGVETLISLALADTTGIVASSTDLEHATALSWQVNLYLGSRFTTQNTLLHSRSRLGLTAKYGSGAEHMAESELNLWEYSGSLRYNLREGSLRPYLKLGYGWTWYRSENGKVDGRLVPDPDGEWINRPSFEHFSSILPNSWHAGAGFEIVTYRSGAPFPQGVDVSLIGEVSYTQTGLGLDDALLVFASGDLSNGLVQRPYMKRWTYTVGLSLGF